MTPPLTIIDSGAGHRERERPATFDFYAQRRPGRHVRVLARRRRPVPCTSPLDDPAAGGGEHELRGPRASTRIASTASASRSSRSTSRSRRSTSGWSSTRRRPTPRSLYGPAGHDRAARRAYFGFAANEPTATLECSLDFEGFGGCEPPIEIFKDLLDGRAHPHVRAVDAARTPTRRPAIYRWTIARAAPNTPVGQQRRRSTRCPIAGGAGDVTFFEVSDRRRDRVDELGGGPPSLPGLRPRGGSYYDINTTADFGEPVSLCFRTTRRVRRGPRAHPRVRRQRVDGHHASRTTRPPARSAAEPKDFGLFALAARHPRCRRWRRSSPGPDRSERHRHARPSSSWRTSRARCSVLDRRRCRSRIVRVADDVHVPRDRRPQVRGPGDRARTARSTQLTLPALYEWEVALPLDTTPPDTQIVKGPPALTANEIVLLRVHRHRRPDARPRPRVRVPARRRPARLLRLRPLARRACRACRTRSRSRTARSASTRSRSAPSTRSATSTRRRRSARGRTSTSSRPTPSIELGPEEETEGTIAIFEFIGEDEQRQRRLRLRVLARRRRLHALHVAAHGRGPDGRPARLPGPRGGARPASSTRRRSSTSG